MFGVDMDQTLEEAFGKALQARRKGAGLSQEELSFQAGLHRTYISMLERGLRSPTLATIFKVSACLEMRPSALVADVEKLPHALPPVE